MTKEQKTELSALRPALRRRTWGRFMNKPAFFCQTVRCGELKNAKKIEAATLIVRRYCRGVHGTRGETLCPACAALLEYARQRRDRCPHGEIDSHE